MTYEDWYDLCSHLCKHIRGYYNEKECALMAYNYLVEYEYSVKKGVSTTAIKDLMKTLFADNTDTSKKYMTLLMTTIHTI